MLNSGDALERLAEVDTVVFDKTGTLTLPQPTLANADEISPEDLELAGALALASKHPLAKAIAEAARAKTPLAAHEFPGQGVTAFHRGQAHEARRGRLLRGARRRRKRSRRAGPTPRSSPSRVSSARRCSPSGRRRGRDAREDRSREASARATRSRCFRATGSEAVAAVARELGISKFQAGMKPADKIARLKALREKGRRVLMVGDGLNDAPALAAANVSMSPISAAHLTQAQADSVFLSDRLAPVADGLALARKAKALMLENLWLSVIYNLIAVPIAILGYATPLIAAVAMSGSSALVTLNAMRARAARGVER